MESIVVRGRGARGLGAAAAAGAVVVIGMLLGGPEAATAGSGQTSSATAKCPKGTKVVAGGFDVAEFEDTGTGSAIVPFESRRGGKRKWTASGYNLGIAGGGFTAFAYCDKRKPKLKEKSTGAVAEAFDTESATTGCPRRKRVFSGGFTTPIAAFDSPAILPFFESVRANKRTWRVSGAQGFGGQDAPFEAFAYCGKPERQLKEKSKRVTVAPGETESVRVKCGRKARAISGGFSAPGFVGPPDTGPRIAVFESRRAGKRGWVASGGHIIGGMGIEPGVLEVSVYCEKDAPKIKKRFADTIVPPQPD